MLAGVKQGTLREDGRWSWPRADNICHLKNTLSMANNENIGHFKADRKCERLFKKKIYHSVSARDIMS